MNTIATYSLRPWNKGRLVGQKAPLRVRDIWAIRVRLQLAEKTRHLALFNLAIDSKLRACALNQAAVTQDLGAGSFDPLRFTRNACCYINNQTASHASARGLNPLS